MHYLMMLYENEAQAPDAGTDADRARVSGYVAATRHFQAQGEFMAGDALQPSTTATTIRVRGEDTLVTDGPFAESREQLIGYYLLDCDDLDAAIAAAARIPAARVGAVEIRPIKHYRAPEAE